MTFELNHAHLPQDFSRFQAIFPWTKHELCGISNIQKSDYVPLDFWEMCMKKRHVCFTAFLNIWYFPYCVLFIIYSVYCVHALVRENVACYNLIWLFSETNSFRKGSRDFESYQNPLCDLHAVNVWVSLTTPPDV